MPDQLFAPPNLSTPRRRWNVALSLAGHLTFIAIAIIAPIAAGAENPVVKSALRAFVATDRYLPPAPPAPPRAIPANARPAVSAGAPLEAPAGITEEQPVWTDPGATAEGGIEPGGLGVPLGSESLAIPLPPPPPPVATPPAPERPIRIGGAIKAPSRVLYVPPVYPAFAQAAQIEGDVTLEAIIGIDGTVQDIRVVRSRALLDQAAVDAVRRWRYTPTLLNGVPVPVIMTVVVRFTLQ